MRRRLLNLLTALSLMLCVAVVGLWFADVGIHTQFSESGSGSIITDREGPGFSVQWFPRWDRSVTCLWGLPYWKLFLLLAAGPLLWACHRLLPRRRPAGLCPRCGYDLRATPGRCPECGTSAATENMIVGAVLMPSERDPQC